MKKLLTFILVMVLTGEFIFAQTQNSEKPKIVIKEKSFSKRQSYFGFRGGLNSSTITDIKYVINTISDSKEKAHKGLSFGLVYNLGITKNLTIQPELLYNQLGYKLIFKSTSKTANELNENILTLPILIKLGLGGNKFKFFLNGGPYGGYRISRKLELLNGLGLQKVNYVDNYVNGAKSNRIEFGLMGGPGVQVGIGKAQLVLEGRYQHGFSEPTIYESGKKPVSEPADFGRYRNINGTVALLFPIGKK